MVFFVLQSLLRFIYVIPLFSKINLQIVDLVWDKSSNVVVLTLLLTLKF